MEIKNTSSSWVKYDKYEYKTDENGVIFIIPAPNTKLTIYDPMKEPKQIIIDFLNVGLLMMNRAKESEVKQAVIDLVSSYGLFGFMTALPTTPEFITYNAVYLPTNHFVKDETMSTEKYLDIFFPFEKLDFIKKGKESTWNINNDRYMMALAMTFGNSPQAVVMGFQRQYAERYDWICKQLKDLAFSLVTPYLYYNDYDDIDETTKDLYRQGMKAFGGIAPTYRIVLGEPSKSLISQTAPRQSFPKKTRGDSSKSDLLKATVKERPVLVWDFHSLLSCVQMMFSFMLTDEKQPIRPCKNCMKAFIPTRPNSVFCSAECKSKYSYKDKK